MLPTFDKRGNLPPGIHRGTWAELFLRFGFYEHRRFLLSGLERALRALKAAGCCRVFIDGSFVTEKELPTDFDGCWDDAGMNPAVLDPVLLDFENNCEKQKEKYFGEFWPPTSSASFRKTEMGIGRESSS